MGEGHWFLAEDDGHWNEAEVWLPPDESHHAQKVLRVACSDVITVSNGRGLVARCAVRQVEGGRLVAEVLELQERTPPKPEIAVYQGAAKGTKVDSVVEKLAELGVGELSVYQSVRSVARWDAVKVTKLQGRWRSIARSVSKQSRNPFVLNAHGVLSWAELLGRVAAEPLAVVLWEEASLPLRTALTDIVDRIALVVGPEGGLERAEAEALAEAGAQLVSLGPRILRTENASVVAASALFFHYGLIG